MTELPLRTQLGELRGAVFAGRMGLDSKVAASCVATFSEGSCATPVLPQDPWARLSECSTRSRARCGPVRPAAARRMRDGQPVRSRRTGGRGNLLKTPEGLSAPRKLRYAASVTGACLSYASEGEPCRDFGDCAPGLYCRADTSVCARPPSRARLARAPIPMGCRRSSAPATMPPGGSPAGAGCAGVFPRQASHASRTVPIRSAIPTLRWGLFESVRGSTRPASASRAPLRASPVAATVWRPARSGSPATGPTAWRTWGGGPAPVAGAACAFPSACGPGTVCDSDTAVCAAGKALRDGMACATGADCASLVCSESAPGAGVCASPVLVAIACDGDAPAAPPATDAPAAPPASNGEPGPLMLRPGLPAVRAGQSLHGGSSRRPRNWRPSPRRGRHPSA